VPVTAAEVLHEVVHAREVPSQGFETMQREPNASHDMASAVPRQAERIRELVSDKAAADAAGHRDLALGACELVGALGRAQWTLEQRAHELARVVVGLSLRESNQLCQAHRLRVGGRK